MATHSNQRRGFSPVVRRIGDTSDYKSGEETHHMPGTVIPGAKGDDPKHSGYGRSVHAEKLNGCNLVIETEGGGSEIIPMSARAMAILREGNRDGRSMNYGEARAKAKAEDATEREEAGEPPAPDNTPDLLKVKDTKTEAPKPVESPPGAISREAPSEKVTQMQAAPVPVAPAVPTLIPEDSPILQAQQAEKPKKGGKKRSKGNVEPARPKIQVSFASSLGQMSIMAEKVFIDGPGDICLVIIQYSPEGHFFIPPQVDEPVNVSFDGKVYKCLTGIYYQIPGTPVMHTVYFITKE